MEEQAKKLRSFLKLLANEHRLLILCALIRETHCGEIHKHAPILPPLPCLST